MSMGRCCGYMHIGNGKEQINVCISYSSLLVILQVGPNVVLTSSKQDENLHQILTNCKHYVNVSILPYSG